MSSDHSSSPLSSSSVSGGDHQYPEAIQVKLYQAFIFSIPILFSIILLLLLYLFYLKRRSPPPPTTALALPCDSSDFKNHDLSNNLCQILVFDECMKPRDSLCCVCLGEFEVKEELVEIGGCKHMFHVHCIRHWLHNNSSCPLCRAPVNQLINLPTHPPHNFNTTTKSSPQHNYNHPPAVPTQMLQLLHYTLTSSHHHHASSSTTPAAAS